MTKIRVRQRVKSRVFISGYLEDALFEVSERIAERLARGVETGWRNDCIIGALLHKSCGGFIL